MAPDSEKIRFLRSRLLLWFERNARDYPWRRTSDPWRVLIAEMMLQRTKADQVEVVYKDFVRRFSKPSELVLANRQVVRRILLPLGLRWRISKFCLLGKELLSKFNGEVPRCREQLLTLPGVGDYVAGAVLSIAFMKPEWIVDSNVVRIFCRFFGAKVRNEARRDASIIALSKAFSKCRKPREANLALLDFAALICKPVNPGCRTCSIRRRCHYYSGIFS